MSKYYMYNGTFRTVPEHSDELMHYGVPGMKWGHRKAQPQSDVRTARKAYRQANREYSRAFDKAYNRSIAGLSPIKKHRQANDARWEEAVNKAKAANKAQAVYKKAKATAKAKAKAERALAKIEKQKAKDLYKSRTDKAFAEYEKTILKIEQPYKRGQNFSDADMAREAAAEEKYSNAVAKAKADYKKSRRG